MVEVDARENANMVVFASEFEAEILVLYHQTTIQKNYEAVVHCGTAQQCAKILNIDKGVCLFP